ncbi:MAG TPA: hypothetical protein VIF09_18840, partial [Polyangiaceae bacterium]
MAARAWWFAAAIGAALTAGCFDFAATSDGVRSDGGDATSPTDGGGGPDATTDAADAGSTEAAPADVVGETVGSAETGADAGSFCASFVPSAWSVFFCADFDEGQLPGSWQTFDETAGTLGETDASAVSPPNSL